MMENGLEGFDTATELKSGQTGPNMMVTGSMERHMARVHLLMSMGIVTSETGCMTKLMDSESTLIRMEPLMKANGRMIFRTVKVSRSGVMDQSMKDFTKKERNMEWEHTNGMTAQNTQANGMITKFLESEFINGLMEDSTRENGLTTIWKVLDSIHGMMEGHLKVSTKTTKSMDMESTDGRMVESTLETGLLANNTALESMSFLLKVSRNLVCGRKENEFTGLMKIKSHK